MITKRYQRLLLSVLSGLLLSLAWTTFGLGPVMFLAFIPLLFVEDYFYETTKQYKSIQAFFYSYIAFFTWNITSTYWIYYASLFGAVGAIFFNSLFMAIVFWLFHIIKRKAGEKTGYMSLIVFWVAFEYLHINWDLSWCWLTLGNGFLNNVSLIQWYEFTGVLGGSIWVLLINVLLFIFLKNIIFKRNQELVKNTRWFILIILLVPMILSIIRYASYEEKKAPIRFISIQPNVDPYKKFAGTDNQQLDILFNLSDSLMDDDVDVVIAPETAIPTSLWEEDLDTYLVIKRLRNYVKEHKNIRFITGLSSRKTLPPDKPLTTAARKFADADLYYESYNTAMKLEYNADIQLYHKSKLVLGVEKMPFMKTLSFMKDIAIDLGGTTGALGVQAERTNFSSPNDSIKIAPAICYESIFGEFMAGFVRKGANILLVITNDGWWEDTPGYKQHKSLAKLRAIECRRSIARSANTGISCFINQRGDVIKPTKWWVRTAIKHDINANNKITFYVKYGDILGRISGFLSVLIILYSIVMGIVKKRKA